MTAWTWVTAGATLLALLEQAAAEAPAADYDYTPEELSVWRAATVRQLLDHPTEIQGLLCQGAILSYADGRLHGCFLAREDTVSGHVLPAGSGVTFTPQGTMISCSPSRDTRIQGHLCRGNQKTDWATCFYPDGSLRGTYLALDETIQGVPCRAASFRSEFLKWMSGSAIVYFHGNGRLARCKLARDVTIDGQSLHGGDIVTFDREGRPVDAE